MMTANDRLSALEAEVGALRVQVSNSATRGSLVEADDSSGVQRQRVNGMYGEELDRVQNWQPFGLSAMCPPGGDALILCVGGNRDGAQVLSVTHPDYRPAGAGVGETTIYDAGGQTVKLGQSGITISDRHGNVISMGSDGITIDTPKLQINGTSLKHNAKEVGDTHTHIGVTPGPGTTGIPS